MRLFFFSLILIVLVSCGKNTESPGENQSVEPIQDESTVTEFMGLINRHRKSIGLKSLTHTSEMAHIAFLHSEDMANKVVVFGHWGFSSRCSDARLVMGGGNLCAENVAMGQKTAQAVFEAWMNSPSHRANIENSRVTHCGLGFATSSSGSIYWTHLFLEK